MTLSFLFPDSCQQDGGFHFLFARWAWVHPELTVGVWARPLFTSLYSIPAQIGYTAAKLFTVGIAITIAWQTWRLAEVDLKLPRAPLTIPLLFLQPSFFIICADTMTEPLFALIFVVALRLHIKGMIRTAMLLASLLILTRPEGFFVGAMWAIWVLLRASEKGGWWQRLPATLLLASGSLLWWMAALLITGDPLFIWNNWPSNWPITGTIYGTGAWWNYLIRLPEIVGPFLVPPFFVGLWSLLKRRAFLPIVSTFLLFFILHSILRRYGLLGSAGYPRYFAAISPAIALITLVGWNRLASAGEFLGPWVRATVVTLVLLLSLVICFAYFDGAEWIRDVRGANQMHQWFENNPRQLRRLIWSQAYMCIVFDRDPWENLAFTGDRENDLANLRASPEGTLIFWESRFGPKSQGLRSDDFLETGYELLHREEFLLKGYILPRSFFGYGGPRKQEMYFFYKR